MFKLTKSFNLLFLIALASFETQSLPLESVINRVSKKYPDVTQLTTEAWSTIYDNEQSEGWLIFDVRQLEEFEVSHLKNAIRISPDSSYDEVISTLLSWRRDLGSNPTNVLFYCSVGFRSSHLIDKLNKQGGAEKKFRFHNLEGGLFRWVNDGYHIKHPSSFIEPKDRASDRPSELVHPYNWWWGRLLK